MKIMDITQERTYLIAEIGQNHQGDLDLAKRLLVKAKECGVDAVKSQKRDIATLLTQEEYDRPYRSPNAFAATYGKHREALELSRQEYVELSEFAAQVGITFFSSPWDVPSAILLNEIGMPIFKVPSACLTHHVLLEELVGFDRPIIISTGMSDLEEVDAAMAVVRQASDVYLLQCTSTYPSSFDTVNLRVIEAYRERYPWATVGFSGHHRGIAIDVAAVALGARVIERHFTLDRTLKGSDHAASLEPPGLARLVRDIRACEAALGDRNKRLLDVELPVRHKLRGVRMVTKSKNEAA